jgi:hypothetical protein
VGAATQPLLDQPKSLNSYQLNSSFLNFIKNQKVLKRQYEDLVLAGLGKGDPWKNLKGGLILGEDHFVAKMKQYIAK